MKNWSQLALAAALAMGVSACAGDDARRNDTNKPDETAAVGTSGTAHAEREFIEDQLEMGSMEIDLGKLAQERGASAQVKEYGATMVRDHQFAAQELKQFAAAAGVTDEKKHEDHAEVHEDLAKLSGADFDRKYMDRMVDDHQKALDEVKTKAEKSDDADIKEWATRTMPKIQRHLDRAKEIREALNSAS
jgi:putative membrane protein